MTKPTFFGSAYEKLETPMSHRRRIVPLALALALYGSVASSRSARASDDFDFHHENVMGTSLELRVRADGPDAASRAEDRVLREIDRLGAIFSGYDPGSEFSRWQARPAGPVAVSPELFGMLEASDRWRERTGGAFDPRVQPLSQLWARAAERGRLPTAEEIKKTTEFMNAPAWKLDRDARTAERLGNCPLSLNAIAKGLIVERACEAALDQRNGVRGIVLNVGGDLRVCGDICQGVGIVAPSADSESSEPLARIEVRDRAVATSGSSQRGFRIGGKWYSHILDPRSGMPAGRVAGATVIARSSADADALDTSFNVLEPEASIRLAESLPGVDCLIVMADGRTFRSKGWSQYEKPEENPAPIALAQGSETKGAAATNDNLTKPEAAPAPSPATKTWGDAFELVVDFEINQPEAGGQGEPPGRGGQADQLKRKGRGGRGGGGGRYRRPYVAVWVEDKDGFPVRTLILWVSQGGAGPFQWIPDLKRWYASDKVRKKVDKKDMVLTIARPTRPPGKYSAIWNGKDDKGRPMPPGEYTIAIDAAREHGTYQGIHKKVTIGDKPFSETFEGGIELKSAGLSYRRKVKTE